MGRGFKDNQLRALICKNNIIIKVYTENEEFISDNKRKKK